MLRMLAVLFLIGFSAALCAESLTVRGDRIFLPVEVNGQQVEALLDSGAEVTVFDRELAAAIELEGTAEVEARGTGAGTTLAELMENIAVVALGRQIHLPIAAIMDLSDVADRLVGSPLPLVLGRELFDAGRLEVDIDGATIRWLADGEAVEGVMLPLSAAHGIETIPVQFGHERVVEADFDLGNGTGLLISAELAQRLALEPVGIEPGGGIGGAIDRPVVIVSELTIAGRTFRDVRAHVSDDMRVPANVGVGLLRQFSIVTDFPNRQVWLRSRPLP